MKTGTLTGNADPIDSRPARPVLLTGHPT